MNSSSAPVKSILVPSIIGAMVPLLLTACAWPFRDILKPSNNLLLYLLGVFFVALKFGFWPSMLASLTSAGAFAYFFAPPIFSFAIHEPDNMLGLGVTLVIAAITSRLAGNLRQQIAATALREQRVSALYRLGKALSGADSVRDISIIGELHIRAEFGCRNILLLADHNGEFDSSAENESADRGLQRDLNIAYWVLQHQQAAGFNTAYFPDAAALYLPLTASSGVPGVCIIEPLSVSQFACADGRQFLETFVIQIAHAFEKVYWLE